MVRPHILGAALLLCWGVGCASPAARSSALRDRASAVEWNEEGLRFLQAGEFERARASFEQALERDAFFGAAYCNLGLAQMRLGQPFEAAWSFRHAGTLMPQASQPHFNLGVLFEAVGRLDKAEQSLRTALQLNPDDIEVIGHLARVQVRQGRHTEETAMWLARVAECDRDPEWRRWAESRRVDSKPRAMAPERIGGT